MNISLVSNSCIPNADLNRPELQMADGSQDLCNELRAIKDISKGEEITIFYYQDVRKECFKEVEGCHQEVFWI